MSLYFKNTNKDNIMSEEDAKNSRKNNSCRFCDKIIEFHKIRDHCHLTGNCRGSVHNKCNINVTQKQSNFLTYVLQILVILIVMFFIEN